MDVSQVVHSLWPSTQLSASCVFQAALKLSWKVQVSYMYMSIILLLSVA